MTMNVPEFISDGIIPFIVRVEELKLAHVGMVDVVERAAVYVKGRHGVVVNSIKVDEKDVPSWADTI